MATVEITNWVPGFQKVSCTKLLRSIGLSLAEAKGVTDGVLAGKPQRLYVSSGVGAQELVALLEELGARANVIPELQS